MSNPKVPETVEDFKADFVAYNGDQLYSIATNPSAKQAAREAAASMLVDMNHPKVSSESLAMLIGHARNLERAAEPVPAEVVEKPQAAGVTTESLYQPEPAPAPQPAPLNPPKTDPVQRPKADM